MRILSWAVVTGETLGWALALVLLMAGGCRDAGSAQLIEGYTALEQSRYDEAMAAAERYLADDPPGRSVAEALYLRGRAIESRVKQNDGEAVAHLRRAQADYQRALTLSPGKRLETYIYTSLGNVCFWLGDCSTAASYWKEAYQRLDREDLRGWVLFRIGLCQQRMGQWIDADGTFAAVQQEFAGSDAAEASGARQGARAFYVQVAAFQTVSSADRVVAELRSKGLPALAQDRPARKLRVVLVGPLSTYAEAQAMRVRVAGQYKDAMIVP